MGKNTSTRKRLQEIYGEDDMFVKARIEERMKIEKPRIKSYKMFKKEKRYKAKDIKAMESLLDYHHLKHRSEGGATDIENGALINKLAHIYIHTLPREDEEVINNMLREYKECKVTLVDDLDTDFKICPSTLIVTERMKGEYNRAKETKKVKKEIEGEDR